MYFPSLFLSSSQSWVSEIKKEDDKMHFHETDTFPVMEDHLPPVRGANSHLHVAKVGLFGVGWRWEWGWEGQKAVIFH